MAEDQHLQIIGEFIDKISPVLSKLSGESIPVLQAALAGLAGGLAGGAAVAIFEELAKVVKDVVMEIPKLTAEAIDAADELGKMAQKTGIAIDELQALQLAAQLSDVSTKDLAKSLSKLNVEISGAAAGGGGKAALIFEALGISVKNADGSLKSASTVLGDLADKFSKTADGADKTAMAMALGGRQMVNMIPLLNQGKDALNEMKKTSDGMGFAFSADDTKRAEEYKDSIKLIKDALEGIGAVIAKGLLPFFSEVAKYFAEGAKQGGILNSVIHLLGDTFVFLMGFIAPFVIGFATIAATVKAAGQALAGFAAAGALLAHGDLAGAKNAINQMASDIKDTYTDLATFIERTNAQGGGPSGQPAKPTGILPSVAELEAIKKELDEFNKAMAQLGKEQSNATKSGKENLMIYETQTGALAKLSDAHKALLVAKAAQIDIEVQLLAITKEYNAAVDARNTKLQASALANQATTMASREEAAGYVAAQQQKLAMDQKFAAQEIEIQKLGPQARADAMKALTDARAAFNAGGAEYVSMQKDSEFIAELDARTKVWVGTVIKNRDAMADLNIQQQEYQKMLQMGKITLDEYNKLILDNVRAVEQQTNATTIAGKALQDLVLNNRNAMQDNLMKQEAINAAYKDGKISTEEYTKAMYDLKRSYEQMDPTVHLDKVQKMNDEMKKAAASFEGMFSTYIFDAMQGKWDNLGDMVKKIIDKMIANMLAAQIQFQLFGDLGASTGGRTAGSTGSIGSAFASLFGGFRADGGQVTAGRAYIVGERKPEIFIPPTNGTIAPDTTGLGANYNISINAVDTQSFNQALARDPRFLGQLVAGAQRQYNIQGV